MTKLFSQLRVGLVAPLLCGLALALPAHARLGANTASISSDADVMHGRMASKAMGPYDRHDITRANGGSVREFTNPAGQVFAVTWSGPGKPDLRSLLGPYFDRLQSTGHASGRTMHSLRRPTQLDQSDLRIRESGHMGWFHGVAYIPSLVPSGFDLGKLDPTQ